MLPLIRCFLIRNVLIVRKMKEIPCITPTNKRELISNTVFGLGFPNIRVYSPSLKTISPKAMHEMKFRKKST